MMRVSLCTHGTQTSIWFHTMPERAPGRQDASGFHPRALGVHPVPGLGKDHDIERAVRQSRVLGDALVPRHARASNEAWARIASEGSTASTMDPRTRQELAHLAGASADVGDAQGLPDAARRHPGAARGTQQRRHGLVRVGGSH